MEEVQQENKMGVMPINRLLITMSLPMVISMLVQALYNVVDSMFVAMIGEDALTAVSLAFPIQSLMIAVSTGTGVGINALLSRSLGEKNFKEANRAANNGVFLGILSYLAFALFGIFFSRIFFETQTNDAQIIQYGTEYLMICTIFSLGIFMQITFERLMQSTGRTIYNMITQGTGAVINIVLDPILIFGLLGFPKMGVAGAAAATVIGQTVSMLMSFYFNEKKNVEIKLRVREFRPNAKTIRNIYAVGFPSIIMQSISSVMTFGVNKILLMFSSTAVSVFGVYFKLQSFIFMPIFGLNNGMVPIVAYNYGARNKKRIMDTVKLSTILAVGIMLVGVFIFEVFPEQLLKLFNASEQMMQIGVPALRIISLSFVFAGVSITVVSVFQALGNGIYSLIISIVRQLVIILPVAYLFAKMIGLDAVWFAFPISEIASILMALLMFRHMYRQKLADL
ncbi:MATE family efflux transporter [Diplocloster agilis]|uniref:Probable multidrug resistance protein NorM n=1 Tax=Diplocloster agilis TaxID=2850323 RepID=A0A949NA42_9FIRM|nr:MULTISPECIES: MATE family efflux transporter [Lachnospiraceae]MBU9736067.1 MATE family efflux transporter [Diplocloster agilis]MCU6732092.1 MATE family efflux transporter [Suonthocola fibrivorans]SCI33150.1 Multidrug export protein mepA [uncultured Clostridium sp.]